MSNRYEKLEFLDFWAAEALQRMDAIVRKTRRPPLRGMKRIGDVRVAAASARRGIRVLADIISNAMAEERK